MRRLILIRHGKSSWKNNTFTDHDRPLKKRGRRDSLSMGIQLVENALVPDLLLISSAKRATETADQLLLSLQCYSRIVPEIYGASVDMLEGLIREQERRFETIALVGHNPTLTDFINATGHDILNLPTASAASISIKSLSRWDTFSIEMGELDRIFYPFK